VDLLYAANPSQLTKFSSIDASALGGAWRIVCGGAWRLLAVVEAANDK
jgi:hypothetical protein